MNISRRGFVRLISFLVALVLVLGVMSYQHYSNANVLKRQMEYSYLRSVEDLSASLDNIKTTLNKGMYAGSAEMMSQLSSKLWSDASNAKISLSQLPVEELNLENTYKFLSQIGNYSKSLAEKYASGEELTADDKKNVSSLLNFAQKLSNEMWSVENEISNGKITFEKAVEIADYANANKDNQKVSTVTEGFQDFEEGYDNYPTLIYDGPFSDHIMERNPIMTANQAEVSEADALKKAVTASGCNQLVKGSDEAGKMPSFVFEKDNLSVAITKNGGFLSYMMNYRKVEQAQLSSQQAMEKATAYLKKLGITNLTSTYHEIQGNICIVNYAGVENKVTLYTDLIKVGVALDNGEIVSFDARGYITNHTARNLTSPKLTKAQAQEKVSKSLTVNKCKLCIIPSDGLNENYCYEFSCQDENGTQVLVYINADTGKEEQILILQISQNGTLTV